jgi:hypothetical protein
MALVHQLRAQDQCPDHIPTCGNYRAQKGRERGAVEEGYDSDIEEELAARREEEQEAALADLEAAGRQKHANQAVSLLLPSWQSNCSSPLCLLSVLAIGRERGKRCRVDH